MPIAVHRQENGQTNFQIVTGKRHNTHHSQLQSLCKAHQVNPFYPLDDENLKPLQKFILPSNKIIFSTHTSIAEILNDISHNSPHQATLAQHKDTSSPDLDKLYPNKNKTTAIKNVCPLHIKKPKHHQSSKHQKVLTDMTNLSTYIPHIK